VTQPDEPLDPLDPRFVEAVLARARRRVEPDTAAAPAASAPAPSAPTPAAPTPAAATPPATPAATPPPNAPAPVPATTAAGTTATTTASVADAAPGAAAARGNTLVDAPAGDDPDPGPVAEDPDEHDAARRTRNIVEWIAVAAGAVIVAFLIRAFLLQAFYIPSESMEPTLSKNDRILVNKLSYDLHGVNRGDLVVFEKPPNEPASGIKDLIKRAIALEGETIELHQDGTITIDGRLLTEPYIRDPATPGPLVMQRGDFLEGACTNPVTETSRCTVGEDHVFVMGDNRDESHDGRMFGPIPEDLIVGRAFVKVWPLSGIGFL
jgi:signal peptidase I